MKTSAEVVLGLAVAVALTWQVLQISEIRREVAALQEQVSVLDGALKRARVPTTARERSMQPAASSMTPAAGASRPIRLANSPRKTPNLSDATTHREATANPPIDQVGLEQQAERISQLEQQIQDIKVALEQLNAAAAAVPDQPEWVEKQRQAGGDEISNLEHKLERLRDAQARGVVLREY